MGIDEKPVIGSDRLLRQALDASGEVIFMTDRQGIFTFVNREFEHLYGYSALEVIGHVTPRILKGGTTPVETYRTFWKRVNQGETIRADFVNRTRDGRLVQVEVTANAVRGDTQEILGFMAVQRDVTTERQAEAALARSEQRYRTLAEAAHDSIFILDSGDRFEYLNSAAAASMDVGLGELIGRPLTDCFPPEVGSVLLRDVHEARRLGIPHYTEQRIAFPRGARWMSTWLVPIACHDGRPACIMGVARDMTERHDLAENLERQHHLFNAIIEASPIGIALIDGQTFACEIASAAIERLAGGVAIRGLRLPAVWPAAADQFSKFFDGLLDSSVHTGSIDLEIAVPDALTEKSVQVPITVTASRLQLPYRTGMALLVLMSDVGEHKKLEAQLLQAQKMEAIGRLAGGIAHDFNNLLTPILGYSELVIDNLAVDDPRRADLEEVRRAAQSAGALTRQLLTFSRKQPADPIVLDLNVVLDNIDRILRRVIGEDVQVSIALSAERHHVKADRVQMEQVLMNLTVNARDAMPSGGRLTIGTNNARLAAGELGPRQRVPPGDYVVLSVADTGTGMTMEVQSHLFEPFFTTKAFGKGTGLGLSTVYGIVQQCNGEIAVSSSPGRGTTFLIYLPVVQAEVERDRSVTRPEPRAAGHETILIVEDSDGLRHLADRVLKSKGYRTLVATGPNEALAESTRFRGRIDLLLTDIVMPDLDGFALAQRLLAERPGIRVLYMSGYAPGDLTPRGTSPGVKLLQKPFGPPALVRAVREALDSAPVLRDVSSDP